MGHRLVTGVRFPILHGRFPLLSVEAKRYYGRANLLIVSTKG